VTGLKVQGEFIRGLGRLEGWIASPGKEVELKRAHVAANTPSAKASHAIEVLGEFMDEANQPTIAMGVLWISPKELWVGPVKNPGGWEAARGEQLTALFNKPSDEEGYGTFVSRGEVEWRVLRVESRKNERTGKDIVLVWLRYLGLVA
jgi:hypothetical protein